MTPEDSKPAEWQHADPCTCWTDPKYGPIIGAECIMAMAERPEVHRLSTTSFAGKRRCVCGQRAEQNAAGKWQHVERKP